jgi:hypothetical protein
MAATCTYATWWNKPLDMQRPIVLDSGLSGAFLAQHGIHGFATRPSLTADGNKMPYYEMNALKSLLVIVACTLAFAAPHLVAWKFHFPTETGKTLWRVASVLCTGIPLSMVAAMAGTKGVGKWESIILYSGTSTYFLVRAYLLVEAFVGLRSVPADVYTVLNWSAYIPHL